MLQTAIRRLCTASFIFLLAALVPFAAAQVTTTGVHGLVKDASGAVVPNVTLTLTDTATQAVKTTTSGTDGGFVFVNLLAGTYELSASLTGFQTEVLKNVVVDTGRTLDLAVELKVGATSEQVEVSAAAVQLQTTSNEIGGVINKNAIEDLPYTSRDALNFALYTPGAVSSGGSSTFNGLPNASMNITLDGMNNNSQRFKSGGTSFYEFAPARLDAMEEVTVSTSGLGADAGGQGAMQIRFTTKRGTDRYHFHVLEQMANEDFNANTYFNDLRGVHRSKTRQANYSGNMGGPLLPWVHLFKNKLFFFVNFEDLPQPGAGPIYTNVLVPAAYNGDYTYVGTDGQNHTVNVLALAKASGYPGTIDPTMSGLLNQIQTSYKSGAVFNFFPLAGYPSFQAMGWNFASDTETKYPTARVDYQIAPRVAWHGTWNMRHANTIGSPNYPEGPFPSNNAYKINTPVTTNTVDWTISPHMLNSFVFGTQGNMEYFYNPSDPHQWAQYGNREIYQPTFGTNTTYTTTTMPVLIPDNTPWKRNNPVWQWTDNFTWVKGAHTLNFGVNVLRTSFYEQSYGDAGVLKYGIGLGPNDGALSTALQNAMPSVNTSTSDISNAQALYTMLTGRLYDEWTSYNVSETNHQYQQFAPLMERYAFVSTGVWAQDSWRVTPNLTVNYGLRWELDTPIHATNGINSWPGSLWGPSNGPFQPGVLNGNTNPGFNMQNNVYGHDFINPAPNIGFAWSPEGGTGLVGRLLGHNKTVLSMAYRITYYSEGLNSISNLLCCNPGSTQSADAAAAFTAAPAGTYTVASAAAPMVTNPTSFSFPIAMSQYPTNGGISPNYANPNLVTPYVQDWNIRFQREVAKGTILSVQYIGNKATHVWHNQYMNEVNILENGFLTEFQNAQSNLAIANGLSVAQLIAQPNVTLKTKNFSNQGLAGQVPLPIFQAAFGANGSFGGALSTGQGFGNSTFITYLQQGRVGTFAGLLADTTTGLYYCRLVGANFAPCAAAGATVKTPYPMNFFQPNPFSSGTTYSLQYQDDNGNTNYNSLQIQGRKSMSHGLVVSAYYTLSHALGDVANASDQTATYQWWTLRNGRYNYGPLPTDRRHNMAVIATYDLPMGKGKWLNINNPVLNKVLGNWRVGTIDTVTSGAPVLLNGGLYTFNQWAYDGVNYGNGMTINQLLQRTSTMTSGYDPSCQCFHTNTSDIVQANGSVNPAYFSRNMTAGQIGTRQWYTGKTAFGFNMSLEKTFRITERVQLGFWAEAQNFLNHPFFAQGSMSLTATTFGNITSASGNRTILMRGYLNF
ncbi:MAG TPA: carboxypeptidase-like regulatory domain-containing protein [Bryobacteraceae bacterium]|nr:carboxypeptidase-like regulatory domain-containing protein [Bryobacteraceae bacterium]